MSAYTTAVLGIFTAVAALLATVWQGYLLRRQLGQFDQVSRAQFYQQITMMCIQRDQIFIENPDLWDYFYNNREPPQEKRQRARLSAMARILANLADGLASEKLRGNFDFDEHWNKYYKFMYDHSPSFQDFWKEHGQFWPKATRRHFEPHNKDW
jgi:hypothetical protein